MNPILKNVLAVVAGWLGGSVVNMALVQTGHSVFPIEGVDLQDMEALSQFMQSADLKYFVFPLLAHAIGTFVGAYLAAMIAASHKFKMALVVGGIFLLGGIAVNLMIKGPIWFMALDIILAYIPMAYLGGKIKS